MYYLSIILANAVGRSPLSRYSTQPPWEFLLSASKNSLQSYELTRLAHASNLRKEMGALLDQWLEENAAAMLARWLMEQRERSVKCADALHGDDLRRPGTPSVSDNFLADPAVPPPENRGPV
jgi:hypothetical protein